nr:NADH-quinone oxidoreductase subunit A [Microbispora rosea]
MGAVADPLLRLRVPLCGLLYVVFAVDAVFLFPRATVFAAPGYGMTTPAEMFVFLAFIALGILYAWRKRVPGWT